MLLYAELELLPIITVFPICFVTFCSFLLLFFCFLLFGKSSLKLCFSASKMIGGTPVIIYAVSIDVVLDSPIILSSDLLCGVPRVLHFFFKFTAYIHV